MYVYTHATVRLHFWRGSSWDGEPQPLEDQAIRWQRVGAPDVSPMLPANAPVLAALALPPVMIVSNAAQDGIDDWIGNLAARALEERMLVQIREKSMSRQKLQHLLSRALVRARPFGSSVVVNSDCGAFPQCAKFRILEVGPRQGGLEGQRLLPRGRDRRRHQSEQQGSMNHCMRI